MAPSEGEGLYRGPGAGTQGHSTPLRSDSHTTADSENRPGPTCPSESQRKPNRDGTGVPTWPPPCGACTRPGVAGWVQLSYLMLGKAYSGSLQRGRCWGQPRKRGQGTAFISEKNFCPYMVFRETSYMANSSLVTSSQTWALEANFSRDAISNHRCRVGRGHRAQGGPTGRRRSMHTDPSQQQATVSILTPGERHRLSPERGN